MTIKVVGKSEKYVRRVICKHCSTELEYVRKDEEKGRDYCYDGSSDSYHYIVCPNCEARVVVW